MAAAAADAAPAQEQEPPPQSLLDRLWPFLRMIFIWYAINSGMRLLMPSLAPSSPPSPSSSVSSSSSPIPAPASRASGLETAAQREAATARRIQNAFHVGEPLSLRVYVSPEREFQFASPDEPAAVADEQEQLLWRLDDVAYRPASNPEREDGYWVKQANLSVDDHLLGNGSMFAHVFLTKRGYSPNPEDETYDRMASIYRTAELTAFRPPPKIVKKRNLLEAQQDDQEPEEEIAVATDSDTYISMWKPSFSINAILDHTVYSARQQPPPFVAPDMEMDPDSGKYLPVLFVNEFWVLEDMLMPINSTLAAVPLEITYYPLPLWKYALYTQMEQNFRNQEMTGTSTKKDNDGMKRLFIETNPYLLAITVCVSMLHSLFDFLAFKNDVSFWKNQKSLAGLSLRTIVLNTFFQLVIFLYLMDNDTSWMILISSGISLVIDVWKIKKALVFSRDENNKLVVSGVESYEESPTAEHDRVAVAHLSYVLYPLIVGQAFYTLAYGVHKGWYSWIISSLTSFVYAFGFIMMTPQLYINYKLKSVAHLPWRAMVYKSLNTFIDDLFAFVIKMPWMHRLSCFRDDLIFFIYLYQRWIYPVDAKRTNEFGQGPIEDEDTKTEPEPAAIETAPVESEEVQEAVADALDATENISTEYLMSKRAQTLED